jgi:hypothetical protein
VIDHPTRREFLVRSALLAAGVSTLPLLRPAPSLAQRLIPAEDLVDAGETFRRGSARGVALGSGPEGTALRPARDGGVFTSRVLRSSIGFTHVGLHWAASVPPQAELGFELRTSPDGSNWSPWDTAHLQRLPGETPVGDYFAGLVYARGARFVQYRVYFRAPGGTSPSLQRVTATVIDSPTATTSSATTDQLPTQTVDDGDSGRTLAVTTREQWGANERYRLDRRGRELWPEMFVPAKKLVVHHTATRNDYRDASEAAAEVRAIYYYHAVTQRYGDVGYTALIDRFGNVYEGRHGRGEGAGREYLSAGVVAGHDYAHNYGSAGVALLGDATQAGWPMSAEGGPMWDALVRFGVFEAGRHHVRPLGADGTAASSDFLRSDNVWTASMRNVSGHNETNNTACPGDAVMALLDELRGAVHAGLADTSRTGVTLANRRPGGRETTVGTTIAYEWAAEQPESGWSLVGYEYCIEGWYKPSNNINVTYLSGYTAGTQPRQAWTRVDASAASKSFSPTKAGQYTFHVRAVLRHDSSGAERRGAYGARHTYRVR